MSVTTSTAFAQLLHRYRLASGFSQEELAERSTLSARTISDLERGITAAPYHDTVKLLAKGLGLSADETAALEASIVRRRVARSNETSSPVPFFTLPSDLTPLVGRERDEAEAVHLLKGGVRILTLTGPGGVGKTRLALRVAATLAEEFDDGVCLVSLAPLSDPRLVASSIARALELREVASEPLREQLVGFLRERRILLLLDNFEQVVTAADVVTDLLAACPHLQVLVTSRAPLHVRGEQEKMVQPLTLPESSSDDPLQAAAVVLFVQRARAVKPNFHITAEQASVVSAICRRLDGLPLAIELASAHVKFLSPSALFSRLERRLPLLTRGAQDLPERQRTMSDAIAWSYHLLDPAERQLFRQVSVFSGGWDLAAAGAVCGTDGDGDALFGLESLVDKSLLLVEDAEEPRFGMLETVREYAQECLEEQGETETTRRVHVAHFLKLAELAEPELTGPDQATWLGRLLQESDNLRAALGWTRDNGQVETGLRIAGALWRFWLTDSFHDEGRGWLEDLLVAAENAITSDATLAKALCGAGNLAWVQADLAAATHRHMEGLVVYRRLGDIAGIATSLNGLAAVATDAGEHSRARKYLEECVLLRRQLDDPHGLGAALNNLGNLTRYSGDLADAMALFEESLVCYRAIGGQGALANTLCNMAQVAQEQCSLDRAIELAEESLELGLLHDQAWLQTQALSTLGSIALDRGQYLNAQRLLQQALDQQRPLGYTRDMGFASSMLSATWFRQANYVPATVAAEESVALFRETGDRRGMAFALVNLGDLARAAGELQRAEHLYRESLELRRLVGHALGVLISLERLALVAAAQQQWAEAARLLGGAASSRQTLGTPLPPSEKPEQEQVLAMIRSALDERAFEEAWQGGWRCGAEGL